MKRLIKLTREHMREELVYFGDNTRGTSDLSCSFSRYFSGVHGVFSRSILGPVETWKLGVGALPMQSSKHLHERALVKLNPSVRYQHLIQRKAGHYGAYIKMGKRKVDDVMSM